MSEPEITVHKAVAYVPRTVDVKFSDLSALMIAALTASPPTPAERLRQRGRYLIEQARRDSERCGQCGCHPDEHGGDW